MSSWVVCRCGAVIGTGSFPNPNVYCLISEEQYDEVDDPIDRRKLGVLYLAGGTLISCGNCNQVLIRWAGESEFQHFQRQRDGAD